MDDTSTSNFFALLPSFSQFGAVTDQGHYRPLPAGWLIATSDVVSSTKAIEAGRYKAVNMAGASVISAILNAYGRHDLPFVFGGDGAVVAVPPFLEDATRQALAAVQTWITEELQLTLRAALVPVAEIRAAGLEVNVARYQVADEVSYAMFSGGGANWAEAQMRAGRYLVAPATPGSVPDLTGLSCRWNPVESQHGEILSIIAVPGAAGSGEAFERLITDIVAVSAGQSRSGHPIPQQGPKFAITAPHIDYEARASAPKGKRLGRKLAILAQTYLGGALDFFNITVGRFDPKRYRRDIAQNTDFRKFDDGLKMTLDIDPARAARIEGLLEEASQKGICRFGLHRQQSALITCMVPTPLQRDHMHFIDGASGGYAQAASNMKAKIRAG